MAGEMSGKKRLLMVTVFSRGDFFLVHFQHAIHEQKTDNDAATASSLPRCSSRPRRRPTGLRRHSLPGGGVNACAARNGRFTCSRIFPRQLAVGCVTGAHGDDMSLERPAKAERCRPMMFDHLVPDKFLWITQRLGRQHRVIADDNGVLQAASLD